jgi:hypothetical protein
VDNLFVDYEDAVAKVSAICADAAPDAVMLCDISWRDDIRQIAFPDLPIEHLHLFDHHKSTQEIFEKWKGEGCPNLHFVTDGTMCTADLVWEQLEPELDSDPVDQKYLALLVDSTSAVDLWNREGREDAFARGRKLSSIQSALGPQLMLHYLTNMPALADPANWILPWGELFRTTLSIGARADEASRLLALDSLIENDGPVGVKLRAALICGNPSEIGNELSWDDEGNPCLVALMCARTRTLSFRTVQEALDKLNFTLTEVARLFGGGGHPLSSGAPMDTRYWDFGVYELLGDFAAAVAKLGGVGNPSSN